MRVLAAMSGGVDSAVAAARAVEAGHDVTGVHLALSRNPQSYRTGARGCCTLEDAHDARRAADVIGIPFYVWDLAERFHEDVVEDFVAEYAAGRTPNPCLRCNEKIKFAAVLDRALALGFDAVVHRPLRPARRRPTAASCTARSTRPRTSPTCSACSPATSSRTRCSRSATRPRPRSAREADAARAGGRRQAGQPRHLLHRRRRHRRLPARTARQRARRRSSTPTACQVGEHDGRLRLHRRPAQGPADRPPGAGRQAALRARHRAGDQHRHRRHRRGARRRRGWSASGRAGAARPRPYRRRASCSCGRTATPVAATALVRRRHAGGRAGRAAARRRARPGRGAVRRHAVVGSATIDATTAVPATI